MPPIFLLLRTLLPQGYRYILMKKGGGGPGPLLITVRHVLLPPLSTVCTPNARAVRFQLYQAPPLIVAEVYELGT